MVSAQQIAFQTFLFCCFLAVCAGNCPKFTDDEIPHASVEYSPSSADTPDVNAGTVATITCHSNRKAGSAVRTCTSGEWSGHSPKCPKKSQSTNCPVAVCNFVPGYDSTGGDIDTVTTASAEDCCASCKALGGCVGFTWIATGGGANTCFRKSSLTDFTPNSVLVSGMII